MDTRSDDPLIELQAEVAAQRLLLRALALTHPDPKSLSARLRALRADEVASHYSTHPHHNNLGERVRAQVQALCDELDQGLC